MNILQRLTSYSHLMRLNKPIGILLLLWPTLWALSITSLDGIDIHNWLVFILGVVVMRSAGCVINDIADRNFDTYVERTKNRPLATKRINLLEAIGLFCGLCLIALILVLQLNLLTIKLSVVALALAIIYPFTKRFTYWPQLVLGLAFAWAIPMVFTAQLNHVPAIGWALFSIGVLWPLTYDTIYAMVDREDDRKIKIKSTALLFKSYDRLIIGVFQITFLILLIMVGIWLQLNIIYYASILLSAGLLIYQQYLIKARQPEQCFKAFLNNNWLGAVLFLGFILG